MSGFPPSIRSALATLPAILLLGCSVTGPDCTLEARPAVQVSVIDSATREPLDVPAVVEASDGDFVDSAEFPAGFDGYVGLAEERPGNYRIEVTAESRGPWVMPGIRAESGACHVNTAEVEARMQSL